MPKVYVLGAGASKALNPAAPMMEDLFIEVLKSPRANVDDLGEFLKGFYGYKNLNGKFLPPLEDVLSSLDYFIMNNLPLSNEYDVNKLRGLRSQLISAISLVLKIKLGEHSRDDLTERFITDLCSPDDSIISLNYDLIIDNAIQHYWNQSVDYGIPIRSRTFRPEEHCAPITLYKLHGSLNWLYCSACNAIDVTDGEKGITDALSYGYKCPDCQNQFEPIIITPTFLKDYSNSYISQIWREAEKQLIQANEVIFVGYSMPLADTILRIFFAKAFYTNRLIHSAGNGNIVPLKITVVQPRQFGYSLKNKGFTNQTTKMRYRRLFGNIDYKEVGFEDYINHKN